MEVTRRLKPDVKLAAKELQLMVRAEAASFEGESVVVMKGVVTTMWSAKGHCACVTCGKVLPWKSSASFGLDQMQGGHFCHSPRTKLVIWNVNPQCARCNKWMNGAHAEYTLWMEAQENGENSIALLRSMRNAINFTKPDPQWVIDFRGQMRKRIETAERTIKE